MNRLSGFILLVLLYSCQGNQNSSGKSEGKASQEVEQPESKETDDQSSANIAAQPAEVPVLADEHLHISMSEATKLLHDSRVEFEKKGRERLEKIYRQPTADALAFYSIQKEILVEQRKKVGFFVTQPKIPAGWETPYEIDFSGKTAEVVVRYGDIDNLGYGWPEGFDPFSGESTPKHKYPFYPEADDPGGTDRIMVVSGYTYRKETYSKMNKADGYTKSTMRPWNNPEKLIISYDLKGVKIKTALLQLFVDDFQAPTYKTRFQVWLNDVEIPAYSNLLNDLKQGGPVGKLLTFQVLPEQLPLLSSGKLEIMIDGPETNSGDGFAIDFVRLLINPAEIPVATVRGMVTDAKTKKPIAGAFVKATGTNATESAADGSFVLENVPCGMVILQGDKPGYNQGAITVDVVRDKIAEVKLKLEPETNTTLREQIEEKGKVQLYGIYFDSGKATIKPESLPALKMLAQLIGEKPGDRFEIAGHTDSQGDENNNLKLSVQRAQAVIQWLSDNGSKVQGLTPAGYGETMPVAGNDTEAGRALNRRVEVKILQTK